MKLKSFFPLLFSIYGARLAGDIVHYLVFLLLAHAVLLRETGKGLGRVCSMEFSHDTSTAWAGPGRMDA